MNNDNIAIALDRLKFYAKDAVVTFTQVRFPVVAELTAVCLQAVSTILPSHNSDRQRQ